jgi:hypothetical protein
LFLDARKKAAFVGRAFCVRNESLLGFQDSL